MTDNGPPCSPADPRPNDEPFYVESDCETCGTTLVHYDTFMGNDVMWHDEFICPECASGVVLDVPEGYFDKMLETARTGEYVRLEDLDE